MPRTVVSGGARAGPGPPPHRPRPPEGAQEYAADGAQIDRDRTDRDAGRRGEDQEDDQTNKDGKRPGPPWARDHVRRRVSAKKTSSRVTGLPSAPSTDAVSLVG